VNPRTINQLKNAVKEAKPGDTVILQVARKPTDKELAALKEALGEAVFSKIKIVSSQVELFEAVSNALR
jgi:hypothetical protein